MDTVRIGKFLAELRREKELTQEQLAEKLGTSNKTISRWENGNYMPPVEMLVEISRFYNVSINEILSGKRLDRDEEKQAAEENLKEVLSVSTFSLEERKEYFIKKWKRDHWFSFVIPTLFAAAIIIFSAITGKMWGVAMGFLVSIAARIVSYNVMMGYVERNAFDGKGNNKKL